MNCFSDYPRGSTVVDPWVWGERQYNEKHRLIEENSRLKTALYEIASLKRARDASSIAKRALGIEDS